MTSHLSSVAPGDALLVFSEHGKLPEWSLISRQFQEAGGTFVSITRHTANPLRAHADVALLVSAHDPLLYIEQMLYRSPLQHLLDVLFVLVCHAGTGRRERLDINLERMQRIIHS